MNRHSVPFALALIISAFAASAMRAQSNAVSPAAVTPASRLDQDWWKTRHEEKLAEAKARGGEVDLLFIGDSITHGWDEGLWAENFAQYGAFNLGFGGDRTQHVLWRFQDGALENLSPKVTVLMIGTNNTGQGDRDPASDTIRGIAAVMDEINSRLPDTKLIVHAVFPRSASKEDLPRKVNDAVNKALPQLTAEKGAEFLDINDLFLEKDGTLPRNIMPDLLHPKKEGYRLWAYGLKPSLDRHFGKTKKAPRTQVVSLWPQGVPAPHDASLVEKSTVGDPRRGGAVVRTTNVADPSITLYQANSRRPTTGVLVCPGGGYGILAWNLEGEEIAEWLNSIGITAAVLKYRVPKNRAGALQDAQRALGLMRSHAGDWNLDPESIGVLGFSAGGHLSATLSNHWRKRSYSSVDAADSVSCRPDFTALIYPAYIGTPEFELANDFTIDGEAPPAFIVQTQDDKKHFPSAVVYNHELVKRGVSSELHTFPTGGHGYGLRPSAYPVSGWTDLCRDWLWRQ